MVGETALSEKYAAYPECKDSGFGWLGSIPASWEVTRHKYVAVFKKGKNPEFLLDECEDGAVRYLSMEYLRSSSTSLYAIPEKNSYLAHSGQVLIIWDGSNAGEFVKGEIGIVSSTMAAAEYLASINKSYYWYYCQILEPEMRRHATGMGIPHVNGTELKNSIIVLPTEAEQQKIANFLDNETAKIDTLIDKQQQLIQLLKEKRQAVISHAVTKGLPSTTGSNAPMRDSGVEWLGEVPEHWTVTKFNYEIDFLEGPGILAYDFFEEGIPLLRIQDVKEEYVTDNYKTYLSPSKVMAKWNHFRVKLGDLIISCSASTGLVSEVDERSIGAIPYTGLIRLRPRNNRICKGFISFIVQSDMFFEQIKNLQTGSTMQHFGPYHLQQMYITLPPIEEQEVIVNNIKHSVMGIDRLVDKSKQAVELMQERRTALISAAVTGKIDVRNWQAPISTSPSKEAI